MQLQDLNMYIEVQKKLDNSLGALFWADGFSRASYQLFGDVLVFDSTYKTNTYNYPLVILSWIDNHRCNIIFGAALLSGESIPSYVWLLKTFMAAMGEKKPKVVFTDQDLAMASAISSIFPEAKHRICSWHLLKTCTQEIKVSGFKEDLARLLVKNISIDEFEKEWGDLVVGYKVANEKWIQEIYSSREHWADAYCLGHFMAMMKSTQRAESLNSQFKELGKARSKITHFLMHYHVVLERMRLNFIKNQDKSEFPVPHVNNKSVMLNFEVDAAAVYTHDLFEIVQKEIDKERGLVTLYASVDGTGLHSYTFAKYGLGDHKWDVKDDVVQNTFLCSCKKLETDGFPCRHLFSAFKSMQLKSNPRECIMERWTKGIAHELRLSFPYVDVQWEHINVSQNVDLDDTFIEEQELHDPPPGSRKDNVFDPKKKNPKGSRKGTKQKCGTCGIAGHKGGSCLKRKGQQQINEIEVETVDDSEMEDVSELPDLSSSYKKGLKILTQKVG